MNINDNLHDDAPMGDSIARVTPLGLEPITAPDQMAHITGEINRRLSERNQAQRAEIDRWAQAFERVFEENERNAARVEELEAALTKIVQDNTGPYRDSMTRCRKLARAALEPVAIETETPLGEQIDGGGELPE